MMGRRFAVVAALAVLGWLAFSLFGPGDVASAQAVGDTVCNADGSQYVWQGENWSLVQTCDPSGTWPLNPVEEETACVPDGIWVIRENGRWRFIGYCDKSGTPLFPVAGVSACTGDPGRFYVFDGLSWESTKPCDQAVYSIPAANGDTGCSNGFIYEFDGTNWTNTGVRCTSSQVGTFADDDGNIFEPDIEWLAASGITKGCNPPTNDLFCPDRTVTRGQMAAFLHRALPDLPEVRPAIDFTDDNESIFEADIEWLYSRGVTQGNSPTTFAPDRPVTRGQMAAFLVRALKYSDNGGGDLFLDDDNSIYRGDIDRLGTAGVTKGCNPSEGNTKFCPDSNVTRGQMAAFLHRALGG